LPAKIFTKITRISMLSSQQSKHTGFKPMITETKLPSSLSTRLRSTESKLPLFDDSDSVSLAFARPARLVRTPIYSSTQKGKKGKKGSRRTGSSSSLPPRFNMVPRMTKTFRFLSTSVSATITALELFGAVGGICTVANSKVQHWASSVKLRSITIWPSASASVAESCLLEWFSAVDPHNPDEVVSQIIPGGVTQTKAMTFRPPKKSLIGDWLNVTTTSSNSLFNITVPSGCVIDLTVDFTIGVTYSTASTLYSSTVTTGTLGNIYYLALDGPSSNKLAPEPGMPSTS